MVHVYQERRRWVADASTANEYPKLKLRYRRSASMLPCDDDWIWETVRSWKHYRRAQWLVRSDKPKRDSTRYGAAQASRDHLHKEHRSCWHPDDRCGFCRRAADWAIHDQRLRTWFFR